MNSNREYRTMALSIPQQAESEEKRYVVEGYAATLDENGKQIAVLDHPEVRPGVVNLVHTDLSLARKHKQIQNEVSMLVIQSE